jgi:hypothetical protein
MPLETVQIAPAGEAGCDLLLVGVRRQEDRDELLVEGPKVLRQLAAQILPHAIVDADKALLEALLRMSPSAPKRTK